MKIFVFLVLTFFCFYGFACTPIHQKRIKSFGEGEKEKHFMFSLVLVAQAFFYANKKRVNQTRFKKPFLL